MATTTGKTASKSSATPRKSTTKTTSARKTSATKAAEAQKSAAIASAERAAPTPTVVTSEAPKLTSPELKKKELIDTVVTRSGIKKKDAKPVIEAMLAVLGEELSDGREMNLHPLGKIKINRIKQMSNARVVMCKLRQNQPDEKPGKDPLADAAE
ncbi:HU family DNA-binding protein [Lutimaribacter sp. EGI FJ00015]|uniref:HU family DNA-binding protein n=1 Tax=Lutimaribacter degradans TaxID=2945989 RepID=A0ACC5ZSP9_9RHOB|nr:HU family DNA-binding protein [Lutimaribacter sp. EGI FJ00013]MCM2561326.1 HU family DNA-binding protein [Lutimaribacter sp. EGI FJ00013]MCO0611723.1 HU family DNA-binding protein [Lutimaribacter sp. EGI FJ00015]MCO0635155.1 HU family DNA-binding protein [Lutimaribacter sp. EGI FJ00014]